MTRKKVFIALSMACCMLIGMVCGGCQKKENADNIMSGEKINDVVVTYYNEDNCNIMITIDMEKGEKTKTIYTKDGEETVEAYGKAAELEKFVRTYVLQEKEKANALGENTDTQRILWGVDIWEEENSAHYSGFAEYPEYWTELLELMGEEPQDYCPVEAL